MQQDMNEPKEKKASSLRRRVKRLVLRIAVCAAACVVLFTAGNISGRRQQTQSQPVITADLISQRLSSINELASVSYYYTNMGKFENQVDFYGWKVPLTKKSFIVSYDGCIKSGIDAAEITCQVEDNKIIISLPAAKILSHEIDEDSLQVFDEKTSIFNAITIDDYTGFSADQKKTIEARAIQNGLLTHAQEEAERAVMQFLTVLPTADQYEITVSSANP